MKYYKSVEIFVNFYSVKPPRSNTKLLATVLKTF